MTNNLKRLFVRKRIFFSCSLNTVYSIYWAEMKTSYTDRLFKNMLLGVCSKELKDCRR